MMEGLFGGRGRDEYVIRLVYNGNVIAPNVIEDASAGISVSGVPEKHGMGQQGYVKVRRNNSKINTMTVSVLGCEA